MAHRNCWRLIASAFRPTAQRRPKYCCQSSVTPKSSGPLEPWNGEFYSNFGDGTERSWEEAVQYGFLYAGGGAWHSQTLKLLNVGDRVWVKVPGTGFVGVARVTGKSQPASTFQITTPSGDVPAMELLQKANHHAEHIKDPENCDRNGGILSSDSRPIFPPLTSQFDEVRSWRTRSMLMLFAAVLLQFKNGDSRIPECDLILKRLISRASSWVAWFWSMRICVAQIWHIRGYFAVISERPNLKMCVLRMQTSQGLTLLDAIWLGRQCGEQDYSRPISVEPTLHQAI